MKKIITFLFAASLVSTSFAQYGGRDNNRDQKDYGYGNNGKDAVFNDGGFKKDRDDKRFNDSYAFGNRERDMQIAQINREYDFKILSVKSRFFMSRSRKEQIICMLEDQRKDEIKRVYMKFDDRGNRHFDHDYDRHW